MRFPGEDVIHLDILIKKYLPVILIFTAFAIYYYNMQPINQYNGGIGNNDGLFYYQMAEQVSNGVFPLETEKPFAYRVLMPLIVGSVSGLFNTDILQTYFYINLLLMFVICLLLYQYWNSYLGLFLFLIPFHGPMRWLFFYPAMVDYLFYALLVLGLILIKKEKYSYLVILSFFIVLTREVGFIIPLIALKRSPFPLIAGLMAYGLTHLIGYGVGDYTFLAGVMTSLDNLRLAQYLNTLLIAFGVMIVFAKWKLTYQEKVFLGAIVLLSIIGGVNTIRFIYWAAPVVIMMILEGLKNVNRNVIALLLIPQIYFSRLFEGYFTDLTAFQLYGGLQLFRPDYLLLFILIITATAYYFIRKKYAP